MKAFLKGFVYAGQGFWKAVQNERNLRFHLCAAIYVLLLSLFYPFGGVEYALLFLCIGGVISLELVNSAVERAVDQPDPAHWRAAGQAKDMAAAAVLMFSIAAASVGAALFFQPAVLIQIPGWLFNHPLCSVLLMISLPLAIRFIFGNKTNKKG